MKYPALAICIGASCVLSLAQQPPTELDDHQTKREEWFYSQREYPLRQIPAGARLKAINVIKSIEAATQARRQTAAFNRRERQRNVVDHHPASNIGRLDGREQIENN